MRSGSGFLVMLLVVAAATGCETECLCLQGPDLAVYDPGPQDPGPTDPGSDPGTVDPGPRDEGPGEVGPTDEGAAETGPGDVPADVPPVDPGLIWIVIPAGTSWFGCSAGDLQCTANEKPGGSASLPPFQMLETEVTQAQFLAVMGRNPASPGGQTTCPTCPVFDVAWTDADAFCARVGARLPSEMEWEYAARGGAVTRYPCGDNASCLMGSVVVASGPVQPVGTKTANAFGLRDMLGNAWEWVGDCWRHDYSYGDVNPPWAAWAPHGDCGEYRTRRGGSSYDDAEDLRVSARAFGRPLHTASTQPVGFRCAR